MKFKIYTGVTGGPFELEAEDMLAAVAEVRRLEKVQVIALSYFRDDIGQWVSGDAYCTGCHRELSEFKRALLWGGTRWHVYEYLLDQGMKWGPYCQSCALRIAGVLNENHVLPEQKP